MPNPDKVVRVTLDSSGLPVPSVNPVHAKKDNQKSLGPIRLSDRSRGYSDLKSARMQDIAFSA